MGSPPIQQLIVVQIASFFHVVMVQFYKEWASYLLMPINDETNIYYDQAMTFKEAL